MNFLPVIQEAWSDTRNDTTWMELHRRQGNEFATSEQIASSVNTNPVVIRRLLGELRAAGLVRSRRGASAGWQLSRTTLDAVLADVVTASG